MQPNDIKIDVNQNGSELIIRTGDAEKLVPPIQIRASGTIVAPADWLKNHKEQNSGFSIVQFDNKKGTIVYNAHPGFYLGAIITGTLTMSAQFNRLKINNGENWSALKLAKHLKQLTALATNKADHMKVVASLEKLKVKVNTELEKFKEENGNAKFDFERTVESNLVPDLTFTVPIYEGEAPVNIVAKIIVDDVNQGDVVLQVQSFTLEDELDATTRAILKREELRFVELEKEDAEYLQTRIWTA